MDLLRSGVRPCYFFVAMEHLRNMIGGSFGRLALLGLWLLVMPQLIVPGWAWDANAGHEPSPLQNHEPFPGEAGESEELKELTDGDERFASQAELAAADHGSLFPDRSSRAAYAGHGSVRLSLLDRFLFRPPSAR